MLAELIRPSLLEFIRKRMPDWDGQGFICLDDLGEFRKDYVRKYFEEEIGELSTLDHEVIESLQQHGSFRMISANNSRRSSLSAKDCPIR
jgi:hypothetical protein